MVKILMPKDTACRSIERMYAGVLKRGSISWIGAAAFCRIAGINITDASSAEDVRPIESGPAIEAAEETAKDDPLMPNELTSRALKEVIGPVLSADAEKAP